MNKFKEGDICDICCAHPIKLIKGVLQCPECDSKFPDEKVLLMHLVPEGTLVEMEHPIQWKRLIRYRLLEELTIDGVFYPIGTLMQQKEDTRVP